MPDFTPAELRIFARALELSAIVHDAADAVTRTATPDESIAQLAARLQAMIADDDTPARRAGRALADGPATVRTRAVVALEEKGHWYALDHRHGELLAHPMPNTAAALVPLHPDLNDDGWYAPEALPENVRDEILDCIHAEEHEDAPDAA
jgi:hypothetical protein